jgi:type II protein arginine methyltransferase
VPLTNDLWRERWERLCLRPMNDDDEEVEEGTRAWIERERVMRDTEREAEKWRKEGGFKRTELNVTRLEETGRLVALASDWLELDAADEGIRFDSELVSRVSMRLCDHSPESPADNKSPNLHQGTPSRTPPLPSPLSTRPRPPTP